MANEPFTEADLQAIQAVIDSSPERESRTMLAMLKEIKRLRGESRHEENDRMADMVVHLSVENKRLKEELNQVLNGRGLRK